MFILLKIIYYIFALLKIRKEIFKIIFILILASKYIFLKKIKFIKLIFKLKTS